MNSNIFDSKRFARYYLSDLKNTFNNTWLLILLTSLSGAIAYLFVGFFTFFFKGEWNSFDLAGRGIAFVQVFCVFVIIIPAKAYGYFTDKKRGIFYTLIPASSLEKFLSMFINVVILAPLAYIVIALAADSLISLDPTTEGSLIGSAGELAKIICSETYSSQLGTNIRVFSGWEVALMTILYTATYVLTFLLGALYFKKNKIGKTILVLIFLFIASSLIMSPIIPSLGKGLVDWLVSDTMETVTKFNILKYVIYAIYGLVTIGLSVWTYIRIKTVKR